MEEEGGAKVGYSSKVRSFDEASKILKFLLIMVV
jgi:hypothetical protein